jgi:hypothetical protein
MVIELFNKRVNKIFTTKDSSLISSIYCKDEPFVVSFKTGSSHVGFVVEKVALGQVFFEYFGCPCQSLFHQFLHYHHHLSYGASTIGQ